METKYKNISVLCAEGTPWLISSIQFFQLIRQGLVLHMSVLCLFALTLRRLMSYIYGAPILDVSRSHTTTQHSRWDSSGRVISSSQRPVPDNTRHSQQTNIHARGGIRTHDLSRGAAANLRLRPRGCWDRQCLCIHQQIAENIWSYCV